METTRKKKVDPSTKKVRRVVKKMLTHAGVQTDEGEKESVVTLTIGAGTPHIMPSRKNF